MRGAGVEGEGEITARLRREQEYHREHKEESAGKPGAKVVVAYRFLRLVESK